MTDIKFKIREKLLSADRYLLWTIGLVIIGLALRLFHVSILYYTPTGDQQVYPSYGDMIWQWLRGIELSPDDLWLTSRNPPGYSFIVGLVRLLFGSESIRIVYYLQAFADSVSIMALFIMGRMLFSSVIGFIGAFIYAFYSIAIIYTAQMQTETITLMLMILSMVAFLQAYQRRTITAYLIAGVLAGVTALFRLNTLTVPLSGGIIMLLQLFSRTEIADRKKLFINLYIYTATVILTILPVSIINSLHAGKMVMVNGSNSERLLLGANPNTRGEWYRYEPVPVKWIAQIQEAPKEKKDKIGSEIFKNFVENTHPAYYWFTIVPNKFWELLWADHWVYVGQHNGNSMEFPFGPFLRIPLITSHFLVLLGFLGLVYKTNVINRYLVVNCFFQAIAIQALIIEARYRLPLEVMLVVPCAAVLYKLFYSQETIRNLKITISLFLAASVVWSAINMVRFGGQNVLAPTANQSSGVLHDMVNSQFVVNKITENEDTTGTVAIPVDAGKCSHLYFSFDYKLERPSDKLTDINMDTAWPRIMMTVDQFDDDMTTVAEADRIQNAPDLSAYQSYGGKQWRIEELRGRTKFIKLSMKMEHRGTITISNMKAKGPLWNTPR